MGSSTKQKPRFSVALRTDEYQRLISDTLLDKRVRENFVASITSVVANNPALQNCEANTVLAAGLLIASLGLSLAPSLGQAYLVPFDKYEIVNNARVKVATNATAIIGWRGYAQLAARSGQYKRINPFAFKRGELIAYDPLRETLDYKLIEDDMAREAAETTGYYGEFELINGYRKTMYWSRQKMEAHALRYSKAYASDKKKGWKNSFWSTDFDAMAKKTIIRQLIGKWGPMSIDMQTVMSLDDGENAAPFTFDDDASQSGFGGSGAPSAPALPPSPSSDEETSHIPPGYIVDESTGELVKIKMELQSALHADVTVSQNQIPAQVSMDDL